MTEEAQPTTMSAHAALTRAKAAERRVEELTAERDSLLNRVSVAEQRVEEVWQRVGDAHFVALRLASEPVSLAATKSVRELCEILDADRHHMGLSPVSDVLAALKSAGIETDDPAAGVRELAAQRDAARAMIGRFGGAAAEVVDDGSTAKAWEFLHDLAAHQPPSDKAPASDATDRGDFLGWKVEGLYATPVWSKDKAPAPEPAPWERCTMGVGCREAGTCYAAAHGEPERCDGEPAEAEPSAPRMTVEGAVRQGIPRHIAVAQYVPRTPEPAEPAPTRDESRTTREYVDLLKADLAAAQETIRRLTEERDSIEQRVRDAIAARIRKSHPPGSWAYLENMADQIAAGTYGEVEP